MIESKVTDSYPEHLPVISAFVESLELSPLNIILFQIYIIELIDHIGDDDLYFELQEIYEKQILINRNKQE